MILQSRLGCPVSLKTPNMGNPGLDSLQATKASVSDALLTGRVRVGNSNCQKSNAAPPNTLLGDDS